MSQTLIISMYLQCDMSGKIYKIKNIISTAKKNMFDINAYNTIQ